MSQRRRDLLCIDDDPTSLQVRKILLETFGFHVTTANSGRDGLRLLGSRHPDAVVLDYHMPGMNGGEVAAQVKQLQPEMPVLMLSALPALPQEAPADCIDAFLWKGEPTGRLVTAIERLLAGHPAGEPEPLPGFARVGVALGIAAEKVSSLVCRSHRPSPAGSETQPAAPSAGKPTSRPDTLRNRRRTLQFERS